MPTELFYTINFSVSITFIAIGLIFSCLITFIIAKNRQCHTVNNLLICDLCIAIIMLLLLAFIGCTYGLRDTWHSYQPLCSFRAYLLMITVISASYSFLIQAISRLFFAAFYTHRFLLTWRTHRILIIVKWLVSILFSIQPFFVQHGFGLIEEYRMCGTTTSVLLVALYTVGISFLIPGSIIAIIYIIILHKVRQSTRRVASNMNPASNRVQKSVPSVKRNLKVMQDMLIILSILLCGGTPFLVVTFWDLIQQQSVREELFSLSINSVLLAAATMMIVSFFRNKTVKQIALKYFLRNQQQT